MQLKVNLITPSKRKCAETWEMAMDPKILPPDIALYALIFGGFVTAALVGAIAFYKGKDTAQEFTLLVQRANITQMVAIVLIILAAAGLRILDKISAEAVVSILSGVAGYVLGAVARTWQDVGVGTGADKRIEPDKKPA
jgi:hypothetical protein